MDMQSTISIVALLFILGGITAIMNVFASDAPHRTKTMWILLLLLLPPVGVIAWLIAGPRRAKN